MATNLHPTQSSHEFLEDTLAKLTGVTRNIWARIAIARSINIPELPSESARLNSDGKEIARHTLFGVQDTLFFAAFVLRYQRKLTDDEFFPRLVKLHLERGVSLLRQDWELSGRRRDDFLLKIAENLPLIDGKAPVASPRPGISDIINLEMGTVTDSQDKIIWELNRAPNPHVAIVGTTGSGKTSLILEFLTQIAEQTSQKLPFIFFDYARGDVAGNAAFAKATGARVVSVPKQPVPLSPFPVCKTELEVTQQAYHLAKIFRDVAPNIGIRQEQRLISATQEAYRNSQGTPPDFYAMRNIIEANGEIDSLTGVLCRLTDLNLFPSRLVDQSLQTRELLTHSWIIDLHQLQELRELVVFLMLDSLRSYFTRLPDQKVNKATGAKELRCVIVVDEAHNFLPKDNAQVLEKSLRELRGKGVAVWMLTQNPDDLEQEHYNYTREVNFNTCLRVSDAKPRVLTSLYGVSPAEAKALAAKLATFEGEGICRNPSIPKGYSKIRIKQFWQRRS